MEETERLQHAPKSGSMLLYNMKSTVNPAIYQQILKHFRLFREANFIFKQDLVPAQATKGSLQKWILMTMELLCFDWPDLNPKENLWSYQGCSGFFGSLSNPPHPNRQTETKSFQTQGSHC
ncbi:hypothetical protein XENOCAPTIV_015963 [Xenoophorus captivus]|uniref:Uncharacterized protein n=1 Tax=Xenoophorus captivus TaxID=1517983 RepID=A0ABV0QAY4_9TELE